MLTLSRWPTDIQTQRQWDAGRIEATVKAACLSVHDWLLWGFHQLAAYLDFHSSHLYGYGQSKMRQYPPMCNSLVVCLDEDRSTWSRSLVKDDYWRILVPFLNNSSLHVRKSKLLRVALRRDKVIRKFQARARRYCSTVHCSTLCRSIVKLHIVQHEMMPNGENMHIKVYINCVHIKNDPSPLWTAAYHIQQGSIQTHFMTFMIK